METFNRGNMDTKYAGLDDVVLTKGPGGTLITYKAIPYPIPEAAQRDLMKAGRLTGSSPPGDIAAIIRTEAFLRETHGVLTTRLFIQPKPRPPRSAA